VSAANRVLIEGNPATPGAALRSARRSAGIAQSRLSIDIDQEQSTVSRWEHEHQGMQLRHWLDALEACGHTVVLMPGRPQSGVWTSRFLAAMAEFGVTVRVETKIP